jgi:hypothetical protein
MHALIAQRILDVIADTGINKSKASIIEILERAYGADTRQVGEISVTTQPNVVSDVTFVSAGSHISELTGQGVIVYDIQAAKPDDVDARNRAYARSLNQGLSAELDRINAQAKGIIAQHLGMTPTAKG